MQLEDTGGMPSVLSNVTSSLGDHKGALQVSPKVSVGLHGSRLGFVAPCDGERSPGPLGNTTS